MSRGSIAQGMSPQPHHPFRDQQAHHPFGHQGAFRSRGSVLYHPPGGPPADGGFEGNLMISAVSIGPGHHDHAHGTVGHSGHGRKSGLHHAGTLEHPSHGLQVGMGHGRQSVSVEHPRTRFSMVRKSVARTLVNTGEAHSLNDLIVSSTPPPGEDGADGKS